MTLSADYMTNEFTATDSNIGVASLVSSAVGLTGTCQSILGALSGNANTRKRVQTLYMGLRLVTKSVTSSRTSAILQPV